MKRVLLVDDEASLRRLLARVLVAGGLEVTEASSSEDALRLARDSDFDVLVTDVLLDDVDGLSLAHQLIEKKPSLRVVFISGCRIDLEAEQRRHPYCDFLLKPFPPKRLLGAIAGLEKKWEGAQQ